MKNTMLFVLFSVLSVCGVVAQDPDYVHPSRLGLSADRLQAIDNIVEKAIDEGEIPHAAVLVARHGKIAYERFFGMADVGEGRKLDEDAIFRIASMTKLVTNVAAMMLFEEGAFLMEDNLHTYIPAFKDSQVAEVDPETGEVRVRPAKRPITIRDVMTHRAGMSYAAFLPPELGDVSQMYFDHNVGLTTPFTLDEPIESYVDRFASMPMIADPGEIITYGVATDVLGRLVEVWSGQTLDAFFQERIFRPLGMSDTYFFIPEGSRLGERLPTLYALSENSFNLLSTDDAFSQAAGPQRLYAGAVGLLSTPSDFFRFCQLFLNRGTYNGHRVLTPKSIDVITTNQTGDTTVPGFLKVYGDLQGFGVMVRTATGSPWSGLESQGTVSFAGGYFTRFWIDPQEDMVIIAMTSMLNLTHLHGFTHKVKNAAYGAINLENGRIPVFKE